MQSLRNDFIKTMIPRELSFKKKMTIHDKLMIMGWNAYREELLYTLRLIKYKSFKRSK